MDGIIGFALAGAIFGMATFTVFWAGEGAVSPTLQRRLGDADGTASPAEWAMAFAGVFDRVFGRDAFSLRFIAAALVTSLLSFLLFFATYLFKLPTFADSLLADLFQRQAVIRQLLTMFVPMNFFITYLSLAYCREVVAQMEHTGGPGHTTVLLVKDLSMKVAIVLMAMGLIYLLLTPGGSFRGPLDALLAVPGVFWGALRFQNLNCVYIYSGLVSSVWLWGWLLSAPVLSRVGSVRSALPVERHPVRSFGAIAATLSAAFYWAVVLLT